MYVKVELKQTWTSRIDHRSGLLHRVGVVWSQTLQLLKQMEMDEVAADLQSFSVAWPFFGRKMVDLVWVNYNDLTTSSLEIMVSKGNHPQMALIQVSELLLFAQILCQSCQVVAFVRYFRCHSILWLRKLRRNQPNKKWARTKKRSPKKAHWFTGGSWVLESLGVFDIGEGCNLCNQWGDSMAGTLCQLIFSNSWWGLHQGFDIWHPIAERIGLVTPKIRQAQAACALYAISKYVSAQNAWTPWACEQGIKSPQYIYIYM